MLSINQMLTNRPLPLCLKRSHKKICGWNLFIKLLDNVETFVHQLVGFKFSMTPANVLLKNRNECAINTRIYVETNQYEGIKKK